MIKKLLISILALALAGFALTACGGDDGSTSAQSETTSTASTETSGGADTGGGGAAGGDVALSASEGIAYDETDVTASAGSDTVTFSNSSSIPHDVVIEDADGNEVATTDTITSGSTEATADLEAGTTYTFYCSVDSHREQGMEGTITVK